MLSSSSRSASSTPMLLVVGVVLFFLAVASPPQLLLVNGLQSSAAASASQQSIARKSYRLHNHQGQTQDYLFGIRGGDGSFQGTEQETDETTEPSSTSSRRLQNLFRSGSTATATASSSSSVPSLRSVLQNSKLQSATAVFVATVLTFWLNNGTSTNLGPIKASSVVGLLATLSLPESLLSFKLAVFCGSFAGMAKLAVIPTDVGGVVLGVVTALVMALFDHQQWLVGMGGRLGFIAQCACTAQFLVMSVFAKHATTAGLVGTYPPISSLLKRLPSVALYTAVGAFAMTLWKDFMAERANACNDGEGVLREFYRRLSNSVAASAGTGLLASLLLPVSAAGPMFCGSFVAMSAPTKIATYGGLMSASLLAGVAQQALAGVLLGGWAGRLGTMAYLGVLSHTIIVRRLATMKTAKQS